MHHLFSVICAFLSLVVHLLLVGIFERLAKTFLKKIHGDFHTAVSQSLYTVASDKCKCYAPKIETFFIVQR